MMHSYQSALTERYASRTLLSLFSPQTRAQTWRELWCCLATEQKKLGIAITAQQIDELNNNCDKIDFERIREIEKETRHDVMAHIHAFGECCPTAKGIIHLGATSCYVTDNADLILFRRAIHLIAEKLHHLLVLIGAEAQKWAELPCLAFTHLQPAQPTTVGKRIALWAQDLLWDHNTLEQLAQELPFLGAKGATGTQASFLDLFEGNREKVALLDHGIARHFGFERILTISSQTYPRKLDTQILNALCNVGISAHKMCTDLRLLAHMGECSEPQHCQQVGSSAMPHKQNPMLSERCCSLSRQLTALQQNGSYNAALQWLERSLDDSANRRMVIPEAFLITDAILNLLTNLVSGWTFHPLAINRNLRKQLPFLINEKILLSAVSAGADRQEMHEKLRLYSKEASEELHATGENNLIALLAQDPTIPLNQEQLNAMLSPNTLVGLSKEQVAQFLSLELEPHLARFISCKSIDTQIEV